MVVNRFIYLFCLLIVLPVNNAIAQDNISEELKTYTLSDTTIANEFYTKAVSLSEQANYDSSNYYLEKAKQIFTGLYGKYKLNNLAEGIVRSENFIGWNLMLQGKYESSLNLLTEALDFGMTTVGENNLEVAESINNIGVVKWQQGKYDEATEAFKKVVAIGIELVGEKHPRVAGVYNNLAIIYNDKGDFDNALDYYNKSLMIQLLISDESRPVFANLYNNLGNTYSKKGDADKSLDFHQKALSIRLALYGEIHPDVATSYSNIGAAYGRKAEYDKALGNNLKALEIRLKIYKEDHPGVAMSYNNIGVAYNYLGDYEKALEYAEKSLDIKLSLLGEFHPIVLTNYLLLGNIHKENSEFEEAIENYNKALNIGQELFGTKHHYIGECYYLIASAHELMGNFELALNYCRKSISSLVPGFADQTGNDNPPIDDIKPSKDLLNTLLLKADLLRRIGSENNYAALQSAHSTYELAAGVIDRLRMSYQNEGSKLFLGENSTEIFKGGIKTSLELFAISKDDRYKEIAFSFAERSKSAVLQESLYEIEAKQFAGIPSELIELEKQLRIDITFYETRLQREHSKKGIKDSLLIRDYENSLFDLKAKFENLVSKYENDYPEYYELKYQVRTSSIKDIQSALNANTALVKYFLSEDEINIFVVTKDKFDIVTVNKPENLEDIIKAFQNSLLKINFDRYIASANQLSEVLISPVMEYIIDSEKLIIIPSDYLYKIPFEALFTSLQNETDSDYSKLDYLINKFDISYHYSASIYANSIRNNSNISKGIEESPEKRFIGFAPVFSDVAPSENIYAEESMKQLNESDSELYSSLFDRNLFTELPHSRWEVETIYNLFGSYYPTVPSNRILLYTEATEEMFKSYSKNFDIIHLATHSFINESNPKLSGIAFIESALYESNGEDGILYAGETYNLDLNADLVVLSSCESGIGKLITGEGMMALSRGFIYSGADNILFSLWKIPDKHTSELMVEFYKQVLSGGTYSESLRKAKLEMIKNPLTNRPRSWAGFILIGSD